MGKNIDILYVQNFKDNICINCFFKILKARLIKFGMSKEEIDLKLDNTSDLIKTDGMMIEKCSYCGELKHCFLLIKSLKALIDIKEADHDEKKGDLFIKEDKMDQFEKFAGDFVNESFLEEELDEAGLEYSDEENSHFDNEFTYGF